MLARGVSAAAFDKYNVMADLNIEAGAEKKPQFLMVTGMAAFRTPRRRPASCGLHPVRRRPRRAATGWRTARPWSRCARRNRRPQGGTLLKIGGGKARELQLRNE
jgi:hypothetical protein